MNCFKVAAVVLTLAIPAVAGALEFQTPGAVGIGGAGVARATDARASYWNPAGLAFHEKSFSSRLSVGVGININSSLAENVDKIGKMDVNELQDLSFSIASLDTAANLNATAQAVEYIGIVNDLDHNQGRLVATPGGMLAFQFSNIGVAAIVSSELVSFPKSDTTNVRPGDLSVATMSDFATGIGATGVIPPGTLFDTSQRTAIQTAFINNGATPSEATAIVNRLEGQLQSTTGNKSEQTSQQLADALIHMADSFTSGAGSIENNESSIELTGIALAEIPIAYGHKFDLGSFGKVGLGAAFKIMRGTVFYTTKQLVSLNDSSDIFKDVRDNKEDSTNFGVDLGAQWRYEDLEFMGPINVGLVVKNINSPEFDSFPAAGSVLPDKIKVEPQARVGIALDPLSWLTLAADMDVTKNKTVLPGLDSQNIGGGLEAHFSWIAVRAGVYKNIAESSNKPVITAGLSLGPEWLRLDIDGAASTEKAKYDNKSYPREAKVEFGLSTMF